MAEITRDVRHAVRLLLKDPGVTAIALMALALGIGANTVIFTAFDAVLLSHLPYHDPDRIAMVWDSFPKEGIKKFGVSFGNVADWRQQNHVFEDIAVYEALSNTAFNLTGGTGPERVQGTLASAGFFRVLGVDPLQGRAIGEQDEERGRNHVALISYRLWQNYYGGQQNLLGKALKLNDQDYDIIGIMPPGFEFPSGSEMPSGSQFQSATDVWIPLTIPPAARNDRGQHYLRAVARLKPGATVHEAQAEMNIIASRLAQQYPDENQDRGILVLTMRDNQVGDLKPAMLVLLGAVAFVLLIACTNVANLLLSKAAVRRKEFAIRCALGAERGRILRQLLTESVLLALLGGVLGLLLAEGAIEVLSAVAPAGIPRLASARLNPLVLIFTVGISLLTGLIFGMAPAVHASRPDLHEDLKEGGRGAGAPVQRRLRSLLVISEVLLVSVLLIAAGLMLKSFQRLLDIDPGFNAKDVLTARVALPAAGYPANKIAVFYHQLLDQLGAQPSIDSAAVVRDLPFGGTDPRYGFTIEGRQVSSQNDGYGYRYRVISPNYFRVMGIPVKGGRDFNYHDDANGQPVAIINESAATKYWPGENPLGQVILSDGTICSARCVVVGIVGDVRFGGLDTPTDAEVYYPFAQVPEPTMAKTIGSMAIVVRTKGDPGALSTELDNQVHSIDTKIPLSSVQTMERSLAQSLAPRRFSMLLLAFFAAVALILAAVGIYGVVGYWVAQRTREIGIRIALGARLADVIKVVVAEAMSIVLIGLAAGLVAAFVLGRVLASSLPNLLFHVRATDPLTFSLVGCAIFLVALSACYLPARRAARVDPTVALRYE